MSQTKDALRLVRTLAALHPLQIGARPWQMLAARLRPGLVPRAASAALRPVLAPPGPAVHAHFESERARAAGRLARLREGSDLWHFERSYGLELAPEDPTPDDRWRTRTGLHPFVASQRARRLSLWAALGHATPPGALLEAARAVALAPELHLLGNHLVENALALVCAGALVPGPEGALFSALGAALFALTRSQWLTDGAHSERSVSYHLALTAGMLEALTVVRAAGRAPPAGLEAIAARALRWARAMRAPDGGYPLFNDAAYDAAPALDAVLALGHAVLGARSEGAVTAEELRRGAGYMVLGASDAWLALDAGDDGDRWQPGHVHADALTFNLWVRGALAVPDVGVASYGEDRAARAFCRSTAAHNTVTVAGYDSSEVWDVFRTGRRCRAWVESHTLETHRLAMTAAHDGYRWLPGAPVHRRSFTLSPGELRVDDTVSGPSYESVSHLWLDADALRSGLVRVEGTGSVHEEPSRWYPEHGVARPAVHLRQSLAREGGQTRGAWLLRW